MPKRPPIYDEETGKPLAAHINRLVNAKDTREASEALRAATRPAEPIRPKLPPAGPGQVPPRLEQPPQQTPDQVIDESQARELREPMAAAEDAQEFKARTNETEYLTVEFRWRNGDSFVMEIGHHIGTRTVLAPELHVIMEFFDRKFIIRGRNIHRLKDEIAGHNRARICEGAELDDKGKHEMWISSIEEVAKPT